MRHHLIQYIIFSDKGIQKEEVECLIQSRIGIKKFVAEGRPRRRGFHRRAEEYDQGEKEIVGKKQNKIRLTRGTHKRRFNQEVE